MNYFSEKELEILMYTINDNLGDVKMTVEESIKEMEDSHKAGEWEFPGGRRV